MMTNFDLLPPTVYMPSFDDLETYAQELDYLGNTIEFDWANKEIKTHLQGFVRAGLILEKIKLNALFRPKFKDFKEYCQKFWGWSRWYANRLIDAAKVVLGLAKAGFDWLPKCEAQARPLAKYLNQPGNELTEKWQEVLDNIPPTSITAAKISEIVDPEQPPKKERLYLKPETLKRLKTAAKEAGMTKEEYLDVLLGGNVEEIEPEGETEPQADPDPVKQTVPVEHIQQWVEDLVSLLLENNQFPVSYDGS